MDPRTRQALDGYFARISQLNGGIDVEKKFTVDPTAQQTLEKKVQESSEFLSKINLYPVPELTGEKLGMGAGGMIASRTDTSGGGRRNPKDPTGLSKNAYNLKQTNFDTMLRYAKLDMWAKFPTFQTMCQDLIVETCALNRISVGWNGVSAAATTDPVANDLGEDVNFGWLHHMRTENATRVVSEIVENSDKITIGLGGDYRNLDALVMDMKHALLPSWARRRTDLVAICGADLLHDKYFAKVNKDEKPTDEIALQALLASKRIGGLPPELVPYFPETAILVTPLANLSIYYQEGKRRRHIKDEPEFDRVADYQSSNEGYVVEDYEAAFLLENIELLETEEA